MQIENEEKTKLKKLKLHEYIIDYYFWNLFERQYLINSLYQYFIITIITQQRLDSKTLLVLDQQSCTNWRANDVTANNRLVANTIELDSFYRFTLCADQYNYAENWKCRPDW